MCNLPKSASKDVVKSEVSKDHTNHTNYDDVFAYALMRMTHQTMKRIAFALMLNLQSFCMISCAIDSRRSSAMFEKMDIKLRFVD